MTRDIESAVRREVEALHEFFVGWFSGALSEDAFDSGFLDRFDSEFLLIPPAGLLLGLDDLAANVRKNHATNSDFRVAIRNVVVRRTFEGKILATYEEWQRNAAASTPPDNGRVATVLFADHGEAAPLRWLHIHETWLPEAVMTAGPYDF